MKLLQASLFSAAVMLAAAGPVLAQTWPVKPVRVIIPYPPGGGAEAAAKAPADGYTPFITGSLRVLGATSRERSGFMPGVPTIAELGSPGYEIDVWFALYAPAKAPADIVARLNAEARRYLSSPEAKEAYGKVRHEPAFSTGEAVRARIVAEQKTFAKAVKDANLKPE